MKIYFPCIILAVLIGACNPEKSGSEKEILFTSITWSSPKESDDDGVEVMKFTPDGRYERTFQAKDIKITMSGNWEWISDTEVVTNDTDVILNGEHHKTEDREHKYVIRFNEISKEKLVVTSRNMLDEEDSGFASTSTYYAAK